MKKMLSALLCVLLLGAACAMAEGAVEGPMTDKPINFGEFAFGETFGDIRKQHKMHGISFDYTPRSPRFLADVLSYTASWVRESDVTPICFSATLYNTLKVAGYEVDADLYFAYPHAGATENEGVFYGGEYRFYNQGGGIRSIYDDLRKKLRKVYGEPYFEGKSLIEPLGEPPIPKDMKKGFAQLEEQSNPRYIMWKSAENGAMLVVKYFEEGDYRRLILTYVDMSAESLFEMGAKGSDSLEGL